MNKNLIPNQTSLFQNKLSKILEQLQRDRDLIPQQTREAVIAEAVRLLSSFYQTIQGAKFRPLNVIPGTKAEYLNYNTNFQNIKDDIEILFLELENLESVVLNQFNLFTTQANRINSRVKALYSRVVDYSLYTSLPLRDALFFTDTFTDTSRIEINSSLLNTVQCNLEQAEGIVTLPVSKIEILDITVKPVINSNSNGVTGNNQEVSANQTHDNIGVIVDNNPDTWFEYERVVIEDDGVALILDLTINLVDNQIINYIRINPNNFGTKTEIEIIDISTSTDGVLYKSIKDDIPISGFITQDEENIFKLSPATSKYAGQGIYTFTPRYSKYIKLVLRQSSPYLIQTVRGSQLRYAIGLRDVEIQRQSYSSTGELVSSIYSVSSEIKKIALRTNQVPLQDSELATVHHQISLDDGSSWIDIEPINQTGPINTIPEVINVNTEDTNSINTSNTPFSIRYKAVLSRLDSGFTSGSSSFAEEILETTELKSVPLVEPWTLQLANSPLDGSVAILDTNYGSRGNSRYKYLVGIGNGSRLEFNLLWNNLRLDKEKEFISGSWKINNLDILSVFVNGEEWTRISDITTAGPTDKVWEFRTGEPLTTNPEALLVFGDNTDGLSPAVGATIEVLFTDERLYLINKQRHMSSIEFPTSIDKTNIYIYRRGVITQATVELSKDTNIHSLGYRNLIIHNIDYPITFSITGNFTDRKTFRNGLAAPQGELIDSGDYSVDTERGIIYSFNRTNTTPGTVTFYYQEQQELTTEQWNWNDELAIHKSIVIEESGWVPNQVTGTSVASGLIKINLPNLSVLEGSIQFNGISTLTSSNNPFIQEVPFIDGNSELSTVIGTEQKVPTLVPVVNVATFSTEVPIITNTNFAVSFSNRDIFTTAMPSPVLSAIGQYYVNRPTGIITVYTGGTTYQTSETGTVNYYTEDPANIPTGSYSVDYRLGEIYLQRPVPIPGVTINYKYSDYFIKYNIARKVESNQFEIDFPNKQLILRSGETNLRARLPNLTGSNQIRPVTYQVNYKYIATTRQDIATLTNYFSPILKDYSLQIVTLNNL